MLTVILFITTKSVNDPRPTIRIVIHIIPQIYWAVPWPKTYLRWKLHANPADKQTNTTKNIASFGV